MTKIKRCKVTNPGNDAGLFPSSQVTYYGKVVDTENIWPYGIGGVPPVDSLGLLFFVNGEEENRAAIITTPNLRPKGLKPGETYFGNLVTGTITINKANGNQEATIKGDWILNIDGNVKINASNGSIEIIGSTAKITAGTIDLIGNVNLGSGGQPIARQGDPVLNLAPTPVPIGVIGTASGDHTAS